MGKLINIMEIGFLIIIFAVVIGFFIIVSNSIQQNLVL